jgi:GNAT superfamily N-acetyltransferase
MPIAIAPLGASDLDAAGELLAGRHRADRARAVELPSAFERTSAARELLSRALADAGTTGVVAREGGRVVGFLIGAPVLPPPAAFWANFLHPRSARIPYEGYAAADTAPAELYREMYAALAPQWVRQGCLTHYIEVPADDAVALGAWFSLGFGQDIALAVRHTGPVNGAVTPAGVEFHQAGVEDLDAVMPLIFGLGRHHATSPIFIPFLSETLASWRAHQKNLLDVPANAHWLAYQGGRAIGIQTFNPPDYSEMARPERSTYLFEGFTEADTRGSGVGSALLDHSMRWARDAGYELCTLHYMTANLSGARFWQRHGFRPLTYRLSRVIDPRVVWG